jgi:L-threonylcarbamoyladenylate synthase
MRTIDLRQEDAQDHFDEAAEVLRNGGLVCVPCNGRYRIFADLWSASAVMELLQSKRRVKKKPSLVFIADESMLADTVDGVDATAKKLMSAFWPGPLTILFDPHPDLPRKVSKELSRANGRLGVRVPDDVIARGIVKAFGGPVLVSSANRERKPGETSPAQIRRNFGNRIQLFLDAGDLNDEGHSTVVEVNGGEVTVTRAGNIDEQAVIAGAE